MGAHRAARHRPSTTARTLAVAAVLLVAMGVLSVSPAAAATGTYVRLAQLTEGRPGTELVISSVADRADTVVIPSVDYGTLSEYRRIEPGAYVVGLRPEGDTMSPSISAVLDTVTGMAYTIAAVDEKVERALKIITDDLTPPPAGQASLRVIDAAPPEPTLDVRVRGGEPLALALPCGEASPYRTVAAGRIVLDVGPPGGATTELPVDVAPNQVAAVVLVAHGGTLTAEVHIDAEGPVAVPPGPVHAGFGGAEERAGGPAGALAFGGLALAAAAMSAGLGRRTRGARHEAC